jgi:ribosome recycling factor
MEEIQLIIEDTKERMDKSIQFLASELKKIRAGKAMPSMLDGISVEYYGAPTPLIQVASITTPDTRTLFIKPWEKTITQEIEKAIMNSDLGLSPQNDGENIIINIPPLTEERRNLLAKQIKAEGEKGKISIRSVRKESNEYIKKLTNDGISEDLIKDGEAEIQKITDQKISRIDEIVQNKENEIKTI